MITQPHLGHLLELWAGLGPASRHFVLAGAQAMKFMVPRSRATRDFDFVVDVLALREADVALADRLRGLGYTAVPEARYFQFEKGIPGTPEVMRIEFLGQLGGAGDLRKRVLRAVTGFFGDQMKPGLLLYEDLVKMTMGPEERGSVQRALRRAERLLAPLVAACAGGLSGGPVEEDSL